MNAPDVETVEHQKKRKRDQAITKIADNPQLMAAVRALQLPTTVTGAQQAVGSQ